jgi:putative photosynthetic complex assembly protein
MSHAHPNHDPTIPRGALIGAALLLTSVIAMTGAVRMGWLPQSANPVAERAAAQVAPAQERMLLFADRADGAVVVSDAVSGAEVKIIGYGKGGFFRATMRRLAKARAARGKGAEAPFRLVRWENGALSLIDPETGQQAELIGFGNDHSSMFAEMLEGAAK